MFPTYPSVARRPFIKLAAVLFAMVTVMALGTVPASAATQNDCTFSAPQPSITSGKANFSFTVKCTKKASWDRQIVWDLVGDDRPARTHTMKWGVKQINQSGTWTVKVTGWGCNEDAVGTDEIFVRVRTGTRSAAAAGAQGPYKMASWVNGKVRSGDCK